MEPRQQLFKRFIRNECTRQEIEDLLAQFSNAENEPVLRELILEQLQQEGDSQTPQLPDLDEKEQAIYAALLPHLEEKRAIRLWPRIAAAASILLCLSIGGYFLFHKQPTQQITQNQPHAIAPGHNQATLTLANGQKIVLTKGLTGKLAQQGNTLIRVNDHSAVAYTSSGINANAPAEYNTLSTAKGEQSPYPLVLADGTKVWLNALSSITFPTEFNGNERTVKITGEAYFEVIHNPSKPFKVMVNGQTIEDIGTRFNINAYDDEPAMKTTLTEGSIRVAKGKQTAVLKPGQQAILINNTISVTDADTEKAIAWKNGYFRFNDENLRTIMRQLSRWYDIDVRYRDGITTDGLNGKISRYKNIDQVLKMLESTKLVHFKVEGRSVTVMP